MAVGFDAVSVATGVNVGVNGNIQLFTITTSSASVPTFTITIGATATLALVWFAPNTNSPGTITASLGGKSLIAVTGATKSLNAAASQPGTIVWMGVVSPTTGSNSLTCSMTGAGAGTQCTVGAISFTGTDTQGVNTACFAVGTNNNSVNSDPITVTGGASVPSTAMMTAAFCDTSQGLNGTFGGSNTGTITGIDWDDNGFVSSGYSRAVGSGAIPTLNANNNAVDLWAAVIVGVQVPQAAPPPVSGPLAILGFVENEF